MPRIPMSIGDVMNPMNERKIPKMPHPDCFLTIAIIPSNIPIGTNIGDNMNMLRIPKIVDAMPTIKLVH
jgi:hypothetical protein